jgi:hypothetical protein
MTGALSVRVLRKLLWIERWESICRQSTYFSVIALTQNSGWGRTKQRLRILHGTGALGSSVDVRYAVPKWVRIALERANQRPLLPLFRGGPALVVFGENADVWLRVTKYTEQAIPGALLVGARIGAVPVVTRSVLELLRPSREYVEQLVSLLEQPVVVLTEPLDATVLALEEALSAKQPQSAVQ